MISTKVTTSSPRHLRWADVPSEAMNPLLQRRYIAGEHITLARFELKKGCLVPMHQHESEQICTVTQGALRFGIGGKKVVVCAGEMLVIPPNLPHEAEAVEDTVAVDIFSPPRADWLGEGDAYLRGK